LDEPLCLADFNHTPTVAAWLRPRNAALLAPVKDDTSLELVIRWFRKPAPGSSSFPRTMMEHRAGFRQNHSKADVLVACDQIIDGVRGSDNHLFLPIHNSVRWYGKTVSGSEGQGAKSGQSDSSTMSLQGSFNATSSSRLQGEIHDGPAVLPRS
jgi:hypothetical protein